MNLIKVQDGVASREPLPDFLVGLLPVSLVDLTWTNIPSLVGVGWWPEESTSPALGMYQSYGDEVLTPDPVRYVVVSSRSVRDWTPDEILAYKASITRRISRRALSRRFTQAERIAYELAQMHDPAATAAEQETAAKLRIMETDVAAAPYVDLNDPGFQADLRSLPATVLAAGRADEIIWGDISPVELP